MVFDAFIYYTHFNIPLGSRVVDLLRKNGLVCWDDKEDPIELRKVPEILGSCKCFVYVGDLAYGYSTYVDRLLEEFFHIRNQQPIFFICSSNNILDSGAMRYLRHFLSERIIMKAPIFTYNDPYYLGVDAPDSIFSDLDAYTSHLYEVSQQVATRFDTDRFNDYIQKTIIKEIHKVVLYELPRVFISHSHSDNEIAENIYEMLSRNDIQCWIDTNDIPAGASYPDAIVKGLEWCNCLVLVYSKNVINSENIQNELEVVHNDHKTIIPFLIDDAPISKGYRYYLTRKQWIDGRTRLQSALIKLKKEVSRSIKKQVKDRGEYIPEESMKKSDKDSFSVIGVWRSLLKHFRRD